MGCLCLGALQLFLSQPRPEGRSIKRRSWQPVAVMFCCRNICNNKLQLAEVCVACTLQVSRMWICRPRNYTQGTWRGLGLVLSVHLGCDLPPGAVRVLPHWRPSAARQSPLASRPPTNHPGQCQPGRCLLPAAAEQLVQGSHVYK